MLWRNAALSPQQWGMEKAVSLGRDDHRAGTTSNSSTDQLGQKVSWEVFGFNSFRRPALAQARGVRPKNASRDFKPADYRSLFVPTTVSVNMCQRWCPQDKNRLQTPQQQALFLLTSPQVLLLGFAAHTIHPQDRLHVALVDGWRVQYGFGGPGQAHGQTCSAHQDTCHTWCMYTTHTHRHTRVKKALSMKKSRFLSMRFKMGSAWPASAGWNGPDPVRFFTGRAGTLQRTRQKDSGLTEQQHRRRLVSFKVKVYMLSFFMHFQVDKSALRIRRAEAPSARVPAPSESSAVVGWANLT